MQGECLDVPLVLLKDQTVASTVLDTETIRFSGEIQATEMELILSIPSTNTCFYELQQGYLSHELLLNQKCPVGEKLVIDFQPPTQNEEDETELMQDFLQVMGQEIPETLSGLSLIDGIRNYVTYDYKTKWKSLSKDERDICEVAYREIRQVYIKIKPFIAGDLSQQEVAEATAQAACTHLNSFIPDRIKHVDFKSVSLSSFNQKWKKFATNQLPIFPKVVIQSKDSRLRQCLVSRSLPEASLYPLPEDISSGTYVFRNLLLEVESLNFDFQIKATGSSCLQYPSVFLRTDSMLSVNVGTTTTEDEMIRIVGYIESEDQMLLSIPSSKSCVYELVQASLTLQLPTSERLDQYCQIGHQLDIDWEKSVAVDLLSTGTGDDAWGDFVRELHDIPKSVTGISLVDGIWNYISLNYEAKWKGLSKDERKSCKSSFFIFRYVYNRIERFIMGRDMFQRSNVERVVEAACEHLNSLITDPKRKVDSQTVLLGVLSDRWKRYEYMPTIQVDPSELPKTLVGIGLIDAIFNYVIYDYRTQFEALSADEKKPFMSAYRTIRTSYLQLEKFKTGDLSDRTQVEAMVQAALYSLIPDSATNYKTITVTSFRRNCKSESRKRPRSE